MPPSAPGQAKCMTRGASADERANEALSKTREAMLRAPGAGPVSQRPWCKPQLLVTAHRERHQSHRFALTPRPRCRCLREARTTVQAFFLPCSAFALLRISTLARHYPGLRESSAVLCGARCRWRPTLNNCGRDAPVEFARERLMRVPLFAPGVFAEELAAPMMHRTRCAYAALRPLRP
jgi:hypothetical protein